MCPKVAVAHLLLLQVDIYIKANLVNIIYTSHSKGGGGSSSKTTLWEGGHREVGLAWWPGKIAPRVSNVRTLARCRHVVVLSVQLWCSSMMGDY